MSKSGFLDSGGGGTWEKIDFLAHQQLARERARARGRSMDLRLRGTAADFEQSCVMSPCEIPQFLTIHVEEVEAIKLPVAASSSSTTPSRNVEASD